mgnify:CR=1 FL=1
MERTVPIEIGTVATIGNVDSYTFKFNLPGISLYLCLYNTYVDFEAHMGFSLFHYILSLFLLLSQNPGQVHEKTTWSDLTV